MAGKKQTKRKAGGRVKKGERDLGPATVEDVGRHSDITAGQSAKIAPPPLYQEANTPAGIGPEWMLRNIRQAEPTQIAIRLQPGGIVWVDITHSK
jgi:hypothetical protein